MACRGAGPVYTFAPGTTITIAVDEFVPHPSYYRIAFSKDGDSKSVFVEPKSIKPIEASRPCPIDANDKCGASDFCNVKMADGSGVLWDNLNPHTSAEAKSLTFTVTLPNIECDNCTVQVIQVMEDNAFHGDYCPSDSCTNSSAEDIYHVCIHLKLVKGATNGAGATTAPEQNMGMKCTSTTPAAGGTGGASAGTSGAGTSGAGMSGVAAGVGGMMANSGGAGALATTGAAGAAGKSVVGSAGASTGIAGTVATSAAGISATGSAGTGSTLTNSAGVSGQLTNGVTGTMSNATPPAPKGGGCSVSTGSPRSSGVVALIGMGLALASFRPRRRAATKRAW
jgi:hypothetical protein